MVEQGFMDTQICRTGSVDEDVRISSTTFSAMQAQIAAQQAQIDTQAQIIAKLQQALEAAGLHIE
jgi:YbbR domain-containing protein